MQYNYSNYGTYVAVAYKTFAFNCKYVDTAEMLQQPKHCHSHCSLPVFLLLRSAFTIVIFIGTIVADINIFHFLLLLLFLCACTSTSSCGKCQIGNGNYRLVSRIAHQSKWAHREVSNQAGECNRTHNKIVFGFSTHVCYVYIIVAQHAASNCWWSNCFLCLLLSDWCITPQLQLP